MSVKKTRTGSLIILTFQERVRANPCEPPESHHCLYPNGCTFRAFVLRKFAILGMANFFHRTGLKMIVKLRIQIKLVIDYNEENKNQNFL